MAKQRKKRNPIANIALAPEDISYLRDYFAIGKQGKSGPTKKYWFRPAIARAEARRRHSKSGRLFVPLNTSTLLRQFVKGSSWRGQAAVRDSKSPRDLLKALRDLRGKIMSERAAQAAAKKPLTAKYAGYGMLRRLTPRARRSVAAALRHYAVRPRYIVKPNSTTGKLGKGVTATYSPRHTCPRGCMFYNDCYANEGNVRSNWINATLGLAGESWGNFIKKLAASPNNRVRVNVAGDLPGDGRKIHRRMALQLADAASKGGKRTAWTYTHYPVLNGPHAQHNLSVVREMTKRGLQVNLSADTIRQADQKADLGFDVAVVLPEHIPASYLKQHGGLKTLAGRPILRCPAIMAGRANGARSKALRAGIREGKIRGRALAKAQRAIDKASKINCSSCLGKDKVACAMPGRSQIIGFNAHGQQSARHIDPDIPVSEEAAAFAKKRLPLMVSNPRRSFIRR